MEGIIVGIIILTIMYVLRPIAIFFHEIGHALPALFFTKPDVSIYVGSFKNYKYCIKIKLSRLIINIKLDPRCWLAGHCYYYPYNVNRIQEIIISLSGVVFSLFICIILFYLTFIYDFHGALKIIFGLLLFSSIMDFIINLIPNKLSVNGVEYDNDGEAVLNSLFSKKQKLRQFIFYKPREIIEKDINNFRAERFFDLAEININEGNLKASINNYSNTIEINPDNSIYYNNRGNRYLSTAEYEKAILEFNKAIELDATLAYAYNNRGYAKIMLGNLEKGFDDVLKSLFLDSNNSYALRNLGIYYFKKNKIDAAIIQFNKSLKINRNTPLLQEYIGKIKDKLKQPPTSH